MRAMMIAAIATLCLLVTAATATRAADSYGLPNEQLVTIRGKVVEIACEVTQNCAPRCGDGKRLLGIKTADGKLLLAAKNAADFMGSVRDLLPLCGRTITIDGLTTTNFGTTLLMVQRYKVTDAAPWRIANQSLVDWAKANNVAVDSEEAKAWMRNDPMVKAAIAKKGRLGVPE